MGGNEGFGTERGVARWPTVLETRTDEGSTGLLVDDVVDAEALWPDELVELNEARSTLNRALGTLCEDSREVFVLYELEELRLREVCERLGLPIGTVASRLRRARQKLARELEALGCFERQQWRHSGRRWRAI